MLFRMKDEKAHQLEAELDKLQADGPAAWAKLPEEELFTPAGFSEERAEATSYSNYSYWGSTFRAFFKNRVAVLLLVALIAVVAFAFLQPYLPGQVDPNLCAVDPATGIQYRNIAPGEKGFIWGSNAIGQDLWARIWAGARTSLTIAFFVALIDNPEVDVVFVCSSTDTHCDVSMAAVQAGKHVFCEKPIDYDIDKIKKLLALVEEKGVKFQVGFNRRFDHNHKAVADAVKDGTIGDPHIVIVSSRDPEPPPASYVAVSGGIFYDMMIHDFDMVRYVTGSEAVEISAVGSCLVNPNLQEESGIPDVDTAVVTMKMANGCIAVINNSRQAVYGYDQRVEAFGSKGMASDANDLLNTTTVLTKDGAHSEKPLWFFLERYNQAFINQVISFVDAINNDTQTAVGAVDVLRPVLMAKAATESCRNGGVFVKVGE